MTRSRYFGDETPFGQWVREQDQLDSIVWKLNVTDSDWMFQKYMTPVDKIGTRELQLAMFVELKTFNGEPSPAQSELLFYHHQLLCTNGTSVSVKRPGRSSIALWYFGVYVLKLPRQRPDENEHVQWGRFAQNGIITWDTGTVDGLCKILRFEIRPDTFNKLETRRHHKTRRFVVVEKTPLGFLTERELVKRS